MSDYTTIIKEEEIKLGTKPMPEDEFNLSLYYDTFLANKL
jgi:hypothetical protein